MKAQVSLAYIIIFSVFLIAFIFLMGSMRYYLFTYQSSMRAIILEDSVQAITDRATLLYQQGEGAASEITIEIPSGITNTTLSGQRIQFTMGNDIYAQSLGFGVSGTLPTQKGTYTINLKVENATVHISY